MTEVSEVQEQTPHSPPGPGPAEAEELQDVPSNTYIIRPNFSNKFRPILVKEMIHNVLMENLQGKDFCEDCAEWSRNISDEIKVKLRDMGYERYKFVVQVVIGEQRGEGVKMGCRCFWDSDSDSYAQDLFLNDSLFCVAAVFGVFYY